MNSSAPLNAGPGAPDECSRLRLFVALRVPGAVQREIGKAQTELRRALTPGAASWTREEQFHLTLRFLGDVDASRVGELTEALRGACGGFAPMKLCAKQIGFFPNARAPRVLWVGIQDAAGNLPALQMAIVRATAEFGSQPDGKKFAAHITLARLKPLNPSEAATLAAAVDEYAAKVFGEWETATVDLMRSELLRDGARHTLVASLPLSGGTVARK